MTDVDGVDDFLGDRLRSRATPPDLRRLVELQLAGEIGEAGAVGPLAGVRVLGPSERHPLEEPAEPLPSDPDPDRTRANGRAIAGVLAHVAPVADGVDGELWGYWLHPDEPPGAEPPIVRLDTEGSFDVVPGRSLVEAMVFDWPHDEDVDEIIACCDRLGLSLTARRHDQLERPRPVVSPVDLHEQLYRADVPDHDRPAWADDAGAVPEEAPIGAATGDPRLARLLARHGLPDDPTALIEAADTGEGEVSLSAPSCAATFEFHRERGPTWFLHQMVFRASGSGRSGGAPCQDVPFGFRLDESRPQSWARLGEPDWRSPLGSIDAWYFGEVVLNVSFADDGAPTTIRLHQRFLR